MKKVSFVALLLFVVIVLQGCGETFSGVGRDFNRIGRGVKTVFVKGE